MNTIERMFLVMAALCVVLALSSGLLV